MPFNTTGKKHWSHVWRHFALDGMIWIVAFVIATSLRFSNDDTPNAIWIALVHYAPGILGGSLTVASVCYLFSLYSQHGPHSRRRRRYILVLGAVLAASLATLTYGSLDFSARIGRGVLFVALPSASFLLLWHHHYLRLLSSTFQEKLILIVGSKQDLIEAERFSKLHQQYSVLTGLISTPNLTIPEGFTVLGNINELERIVNNQQINCVLATAHNIQDEVISTAIRSLRYSGVSVTNLITICEEVYQAVPLALVDAQWLLSASSHPEWIYIRKFKRIFDILTASFFLIALSPFLLAGMLAVRLGSKGPVFYSQIRSGRFGRDFKVTKLRTMRVDAEKNGAQWSSSHDDRITMVGKILRKTRIDEIPQLWSILTGSMSFVGPRPERPEFVRELAVKIPYNNERLMIQPGLTGWAQVCYPYGASVEDAARKLEYDLYYMKHMGVVLDLFILLDTVKTILRGGTSRNRHELLSEFSQHLRSDLDPSKLSGSPPSKAIVK